MNETLTYVAIGFSVVFVGLLCLIGIIYLMSFLVSLAKREYTPRRKRNLPDVLPENTIPAPAALKPNTVSLLESGDRRSAVAAISAAVAEYLGSDVSAIRIHSIRQLGSAPVNTDRRELIAVISASIASEMGTDISGIRICSIKKVS